MKNMWMELDGIFKMCKCTMPQLPSTTNVRSKKITNLIRIKHSTLQYFFVGKDPREQNIDRTSICINTYFFACYNSKQRNMQAMLITVQSSFDLLPVSKRHTFMSAQDIITRSFPHCKIFANMRHQLGSLGALYVAELCL